MIKSKIQTTTQCSSHYCKRCNHDLIVKMSWKFYLFIAIFWVLMVFLANWVTIFSKSTDCYKREYISGKDTDLETIKTTDIDCPDN